MPSRLAAAGTAAWKLPLLHVETKGRAKMRYFIAISVAVLMVGCHRSGTWIDDSNNWSRAFGSEKPADVVVIHSKYWRSPHWTYECQYFFHIKANDSLHHQLFTTNEPRKIDGDNVVEASQHFFGDKPDWFLPKPIEKYDVWIYKEENFGHFKVFIDKDNQDLFLTDYQV